MPQSCHAKCFASLKNNTEVMRVDKLHGKTRFRSSVQMNLLLCKVGQMNLLNVIFISMVIVLAF